MFMLLSFKAGLRPCSHLHGEGLVSAVSFANDLADSTLPGSKHLKSIRITVVLSDVKDLAEGRPPSEWCLREFSRHLVLKVLQRACILSKLVAACIS